MLLFSFERPLRARRNFAVLSVAVSYSIHPLLFEAQEVPVRALVTLTGGCVALSIPVEDRNSAADRSIGRVADQRRRYSGHRAYLLGFLALEAYCQVLHGLAFGDKTPFLPLMLVSLYCSVAVIGVWAALLGELLALCTLQERREA